MAELKIVTTNEPATAKVTPEAKDTKVPAGSPSDADEQSRTAGSGLPRKRIGRYLVAATVLVAGGIYGAAWLMERWGHVYVTDSRIAANVVTVSSRAPGTVTALPVLAGDAVRKGDRLAAIDQREAKLKLEEIEAEIKRIEADQARLKAQQEMVRAQTGSRLEAARSRVTSAEADLRSKEADLERAGNESERARSLHNRQIVTEQRYDEVRASLVSAEQGVLRAKAGVEAAKADLKVVEADLAQVELLDRQVVVLEAQRTAQIARRDQQRIDLGEREVAAAFDGVIDATFVDVGEYVSAGTRLFMYHDPSAIWVDANVKETDFAKLKLGAPAVITVDAYPGREFKGEVVRLGQAATSQFALLPSPNPSGNFTKVAQRLPVRISVAQQDLLLRPGMMVEVAIDAVD
jgi:membrane fusion protein (multidrug efflux system)